MSIGSDQARNRSRVASFISREVNHHLICAFLLESGMTTLKLDVILFDGGWTSPFDNAQIKKKKKTEGLWSLKEKSKKLKNNLSPNMVKRMFYDILKIMLTTK